MSFPGSVLLSPKDIITPTSDKRHRLGTRGYTTDGRAFRYAKNGAAALVRGKIMQAVTQGDMAYSTNSDIYSDTGVTTTWTFIRLNTTWASPGGSTGVTKNFFQDGYVFTGSTEGKGGLMVQIKSNTTGSTDTAAQFTTLTFQDDARWEEDFDTETRVAVFKNQYDGVITQAGAAIGTNVRIVGVAPCEVPISYYFWVQSWGAACVQQVATTWAAGDEAMLSSSTGVMRSTSTDIAVNAASQTRPKIGYMLAPQTSDGDFCLMQLTIDA